MLVTLLMERGKEREHCTSQMTVSNIIAQYFRIDGTFKDGEPHGLCKWNYAKTRVENLTIITE